MLGIAPTARIVDITHDVPPHDVRAGALALVRASQYLPDGAIVVAVVDPEVGTDRRLVAAEVERGVVLGPDNGLLAPSVAMAGGARKVIHLTNTEYQLPAPSPTFAGRDVLSPAAGYLAAGMDIGELGEPVDPAGLVPGLLPLPRTEGDVLEGEVWWVDRFGNCQLNIDPQELSLAGAEIGSTLELRMGDETRSTRWVHTYADARPSELVLVVDSYGLVSIACNRESAADALSLRAGSAVTVVAPG
jgi:S-adenosyl-L-methionine hydrolase (adenosine-forming)